MESFMETGYIIIKTEKYNKRVSIEQAFFEGAWYWYYPSGAVRAEEFYRKGKLEGTVIEI